MVTDFLKVVSGPLAATAALGIDVKTFIAILAALALGFVAFRTQVLKLVKAERDELSRRVELLQKDNDRLAAENLELKARPDVRELSANMKLMAEQMTQVAELLSSIHTAVVPPSHAID